MDKKQAYQAIIKATQARKLVWRKFEIRGAEFACSLECDGDIVSPQLQVRRDALSVLYHAMDKGMVEDIIEFNPTTLREVLYAIEGSGPGFSEPFKTIVESGLDNALAKK